MRDAVAFFAGMAFPCVARWALTSLHDYVYMPLFWVPRHRRRCAELEAKRAVGGR